MALITSENITITNPVDGEISTAYAVVKVINGLNELSRELVFGVYVYYNQEAREEEKRTIYTHTYSITGADYDTYISGAMGESSVPAIKSIIASIYQYIKDKNLMVGDKQIVTQVKDEEGNVIETIQNWIDLV